MEISGTNNQYQLATNSPLAKLYSSSTLERHHLNQALIILNLDGHRILDTLSPVEYAKTLGVIEHAILATDLAIHFSHLGQLKRLAAAGAGGLDWANQVRGHTMYIQVYTHITGFVLPGER